MQAQQELGSVELNFGVFDFDLIDYDSLIGELQLLFLLHELGQFFNCFVES
jgi:hypothetical protein